MKIITDFLFGGPQALMQDLMGMAQQAMGMGGGGMGGQGGQGGMGGGQGGQVATQGPYAGQPINQIPWMNRQQLADYRRTGQFPAAPGGSQGGSPGSTGSPATEKPQSTETSGKKPAAVPTTKETAPVGGPDLSAPVALSRDAAAKLPAAGGGTEPAAFPASTDGGGGGGPSDYNPASYAQQVGQLESSGNLYARTGSNVGLYQFGPAEQREFGITNPYDRAQQDRALQLETRRNQGIFSRAFGRQPSAAELYLMHQQGLAGGPALIRAAQANPNTPAWQVINRFYRNPNTAVRAIYGNVLNNDPLKRVAPSQITAGQFVDMWKRRFARGYRQAA